MNNNCPPSRPWPRLALPGTLLKALGVALGATLALAGCRHQADGCRPDPAADAPAVPVRLERLEKPFFQIKTPEQAAGFLAAHPQFARLYLQRQPGNAAQLAQAMSGMATNPALQKLGRETAAAFADSAALPERLGELFGHTKHYFPDFRAPRAATYVSGLLSKDIYVNDSLLVMSLDWFAGPRASYRPDLPQYILRRYTPAYLLPAVALDVASKYNQKALTGNAMLDDMVYFGKALYFAGQVLPCTPDSVLMGYTTKEITGLQANEARVWGHFLEKNLLYTNTPFLLQKYVGERPNVPEIDKTCPGRVGQWVGLQIVRKYMAQHPQVSMARLLAEKSGQRILDGSKYRPKK